MANFFFVVRIQQFKRKMNLTKMMVSLQVQVATFAVKSGNIWFGIMLDYSRDNGITYMEHKQEMTPF